MRKSIQSAAVAVLAVLALAGPVTAMTVETYHFVDTFSFPTERCATVGSGTCASRALPRSARGTR